MEKNKPVTNISSLSTTNISYFEKLIQNDYTKMKDMRMTSFDYKAILLKSTINLAHSKHWIMSLKTLLLIKQINSSPDKKTSDKLSLGNHTTTKEQKITKQTATLEPR